MYSYLESNFDLSILFAHAPPSGVPRLMFGLVAAVEHVEVGLEVLHGEDAASVADGLHDLLVRVDRVALQEAARAAQVDDVVGGEREQAVLVRGQVEGVFEPGFVQVGFE